MTGTATLEEVKAAVRAFEAIRHPYIRFSIRGKPERDGRVEVRKHGRMTGGTNGHCAYLARQIEEGVDRWAVVVADEYVKNL